MFLLLLPPPFSPLPAGWHQHFWRVGINKTLTHIQACIHTYSHRGRQKAGVGVLKGGDVGVAIETVILQVWSVGVIKKKVALNYHISHVWSQYWCLESEPLSFIFQMKGRLRAEIRHLIGENTKKVWEEQMNHTDGSRFLNKTFYKSVVN